MNMYLVVKTYPVYQKLSIPLDLDKAIYFTNLLNEDITDNLFAIEAVYLGE